MGVARFGMVALMLALTACASPREPGFHGQRTVFSNPYVPPVIDQGTIGPRCDEVLVRRSVCTSGAIIYPGRGRTALLPSGEIVRLTRAERRFLRDRADALRAAEARGKAYLGPLGSLPTLGGLVGEVTIMQLGGTFGIGGIGAELRTALGDAIRLQFATVQ